MAGSILRQGLVLKKLNKIDNKRLNLYFRALNDYKLGKLDLGREEGNIKFIILEEEKKEGIDEEKSFIPEEEDLPPIS